MRAIGTRTISFGLVSIPVKIYSTTNSSESISFRMLNKKNNGRVKQQYIDAKTGEVVSRGDMVKGYEFAKDQFVTFTTEELKALEAESTTEIGITEFVPLRSIEPVLFDKTYFLGPDKGGDRAYVLLAKALNETGLCAVAQYGARGKQYLVVLRANDQEGLEMQQLVYPEEVRGFGEVPRTEGIEIGEAEMNLALQLIEASAKEEFDAAQYQDEVKVRVQEAVQKKIEGEEVSFAEPTAPKARVIDLMDALKASLDLAGDGEERKPAKSAQPEDEQEQQEAGTS